MNDRKIPRAPELLGDLADIIADKLVKANAGIEPERAAEIGMEVADHMRFVWGGAPIYFPTGDAIDISRKWMQIYEEFDGSNHFALHVKYEMSLVHIYRVVKTVGEEMRRKRQGDLFQGEEK